MPPKREPSRREPWVPAGGNMRWEPLWDMTDEFWQARGTTPSLGAKWIPLNPTWAGRQPGFFRPGNVVLTQTSLQLWSKEDSPHWRSAYDRQVGMKDGVFLRKKGYRDFSTSFVRSRATQLYGYFEIYAKMMVSDISSAFWLARDEGKGRWHTEIDVFEYSTTQKRSEPHRRMLHTNLHVHKSPGWPKRKFKVPEHEDMGYDLSKTPQKWAVDWTPEYIRWYLNDKPVRTTPNKLWHRPLHLQFDSETFPDWFGLPTKGRNNLPNKFEIFYVRSWKRVPK